MKEDKYIKLFYKKQSGEISPKERSDLEDWEKASEENQRTIKSLEQSWDLSEDYGTDLDIDLNADFDLLEKRMDAEEGRTGKVVPMPARRKWLRVAASVVVLIVAGFLVQNLFLASPDWQVYHSGNTSEETLELFDGTKIWLNEGSQISFLEEAWKGQRLVKLEGEAFFDVAKNKAQPFIIETASGTVQVLGTSFSVRDYQNEEEMSVVVKTGKVRMQPKVGDAHLDLIANEKGVFEKNEKDLHKRKDEQQNDLAWHTQKLSFLNTPLHQVLRKVGELYKVEIELEDSTLRMCSFKNTFEKKSLAIILEIIKTTYGMDLEQIKEGKYILRGGACIG